MKLPKGLQNKKMAVFDLDGTLNESKQAITNDMARLLVRLLEKKYVAVISGGAYPQFQKQLLARFRAPEALLNRLFLFPTCSTIFYRYNHGWKKVYGHYLSLASRRKIKKAFERTFFDMGYQHPAKVFGQVIEDRLTQIAFSAVGQKAPVSVKKRWNKNQDVRPQMMRILARYIPEFEIRRGGLTTIDVTKRGIDKAYGIRQIQKQIGIKIRDMVFVGDALYPGGNDYAAKKTGVLCVKVDGPNETKKVIRALVGRTQ